MTKNNQSPRAPGDRHSTCSPWSRMGLPMIEIPIQAGRDFSTEQQAHNAAPEQAVLHQPSMKANAPDSYCGDFASNKPNTLEKGSINSSKASDNTNPDRFSHPHRDLNNAFLPMWRREPTQMLPKGLDSTAINIESASMGPLPFPSFFDFT